MSFSFFALLNRMRWIRRWSLMRNLNPENLAEHSFDVALIAHNLALLRRSYFASEGRICPSPEKVLAKALFHDVSEILTGDLPTPVKYANPHLRSHFGQLEQEAAERLLRGLPRELWSAYAPLLQEEGAVEDVEALAVQELVKAADKLSAYLKCLQEVNQGNREFVMAMQSTEAALHRMKLPEVEYFIENFAPCYDLPLDALQLGTNEGED